MNFWQEFKSPIYCLAPMAGFTDKSFRIICSELGADVVYSEMASAQALNYSPEKTLKLLEFNRKRESKYVVQLFGSDPKFFKKAVKIVEEKIKPDGIDINFGCPVPKVLKQKAGAALMKDLKLSREIIQATLEGANLPLSIKTRIQVGNNTVIDFLKNIKDLDIKAVMIHGRSLTEGFSGEINTETIKEAKEYVSGKLLANGGMNDLKEAKRILKQTEADGLGLARGILSKPWLFKELKKDKALSYQEKDIFKILRRHAKLKYKFKGEEGIKELRKHLCYYVTGFKNASFLRKEFIQANTYKDIKKIIKNYDSLYRHNRKE